MHITLVNQIIFTFIYIITLQILIIKIIKRIIKKCFKLMSPVYARNII
jgi:hypothetical protein